MHLRLSCPRFANQQRLPRCVQAHTNIHTNKWLDAGGKIGLCLTSWTWRVTHDVELRIIDIVEVTGSIQYRPPYFTHGKKAGTPIVRAF